MKLFIEYLQKTSLPDRILLSLFAACFILGIYGTLIEPFRLKTTDWTISTEKWPHSQPLKIAVLTDMHMIWPWMTPEHLEDIITATNRLDPDIVVLLGDYVSTHPFGIQIDPGKGLAPLEKLTPRCGVYGVIGNHDLHPDTGWPAALLKTSVTVLQNQAVSVTCHGQKFWVAGLEDLWWQNTSVDETLSQVTDSAPVIMLMHNPDSFPGVPGRVTLSLAGHTHGGQIRFPFIGAVAAVIPSEYGERFAYGHIIEGNKDLVVSSGLGTTGIPVRLMMPPEIALVALIRK